MLCFYQEGERSRETVHVADLRKDKFQLLVGEEARKHCSFPQIVPVPCCMAFVTKSKSHYVHSTSSQDATDWADSLASVLTSANADVGGQPHSVPTSPAPSTGSAASPGAADEHAQRSRSTSSTPDGPKSPTGKVSKLGRIRSFSVRRRPSFLSFRSKQSQGKAAEAPAAVTRPKRRRKTDDDGGEMSPTDADVSETVLAKSEDQHVSSGISKRLPDGDKTAEKAEEVPSAVRPSSLASNVTAVKNDQNVTPSTASTVTTTQTLQESPATKQATTGDMGGAGMTSSTKVAEPSPEEQAEQVCPVPSTEGSEDLVKQDTHVMDVAALQDTKQKANERPEQHEAEPPGTTIATASQSEDNATGTQQLAEKPLQLASLPSEQIETVTSSLVDNCEEAATESAVHDSTGPSQGMHTGRKEDTPLGEQLQTNESAQSQVDQAEKPDLKPAAGNDEVISATIETSIGTAEHNQAKTGELRIQSRQLEEDLLSGEKLTAELPVPVEHGISQAEDTSPPSESVVETPTTPVSSAPQIKEEEPQHKEEESPSKGEQAGRLTEQLPSTTLNEKLSPSPGVREAQSAEEPSSKNVSPHQTSVHSEEAADDEVFIKEENVVESAPEKNQPTVSLETNKTLPARAEQENSFADPPFLEETTRKEQDSFSEDVPSTHSLIEKERKEMEAVEKKQALFRRQSLKERQEKEKLRLQRWRNEQQDKERAKKEKYREDVRQKVSQMESEMLALEEMREEQAREQERRLQKIEEERRLQEEQQAAVLAKARISSQPRRKKPSQSEDEELPSPKEPQATNETLQPERAVADDRSTNLNRIEEERMAIEKMEQELAERRARRAKEGEEARQEKERRRQKEAELRRQQELEKEEEKRQEVALRLREEMERLAQVKHEQKAREDERAREREAQIEAERRLLKKHDKHLTSIREKLMQDHDQLRRDREESRLRHLRAEAEHQAKLKREARDTQPTIVVRKTSKEEQAGRC